jgi:hypothetical protein
MKQCCSGRDFEIRRPLVIGLPAWWAHSLFTAWSERILARAEA